MLPGSHQQVGVDKDTQHAQRPVVLDESHPSHVACEVEYFIAAFGSAEARLFLLQVGNDILRFSNLLIPLVNWLDINNTHSMATACHFFSQVAADETAAAGN
jgi:hypothetical protein